MLLRKIYKGDVEFDQNQIRLKFLKTFRKISASESVGFGQNVLASLNAYNRKLFMSFDSMQVHNKLVYALNEAGVSGIYLQY